MSREKIIILLTVFVDVVGIGIVIPVLPYYVQGLGASAMTVTTLFAVFSLCSFFSAPILGALSDKYGRRPALIVSIASTALGWFVFGAAKSVAWLFAGRVIDGLAAGNFPIAQSYMADLAKNSEERTANMGLIGAVFGIGFIVGPLLGSLLAHVSPAFPFWFVGGLATLNTIAAWFFLPETNLALAHHRAISINPFTPLMSAFKDIVLRTRYAALFLFSLALAVQYSVFALYVQHAFSFNVLQTGYTYAAIGLLVALNQGLLMKQYWLKRFHESTLEIWMYLPFALGFFFMGMSSLLMFSLGLLLNVVGQSVLRAVLASRITGFADPTKKGEVAGIMASIMTVAMVIGPLAVGGIYAVGEQLPFIVSGFLLLVAFVIMYRFRSSTAEPSDLSGQVEPLEVL